MVTVADLPAVSGVQHSVPSTRVERWVPGWHPQSGTTPPPGRAASPCPVGAPHGDRNSCHRSRQVAGAPQWDRVLPRQTRCTLLLSPFARTRGWGFGQDRAGWAGQGWGTAALGAGMLHRGSDGEDMVFQMLSGDTHCFLRAHSSGAESPRRGQRPPTLPSPSAQQQGLVLRVAELLLRGSSKSFCLAEHARPCARHPAMRWGGHGAVVSSSGNV